MMTSFNAEGIEHEIGLSGTLVTGIAEIEKYRFRSFRQGMTFVMGKGMDDSLLTGQYRPTLKTGAIVELMAPMEMRGAMMRTAETCRGF
jgi:hypothetical protein